ncbi:hypothetical protein [Tenacibaculum jejuense]|uniref:Uncharacterized protein n=1 Tax=Tenacibaculum jejuense TaxID=584609 RepID=A0A238UAD1_9FLAO|nr:hypothetical protein [Tenacibaculum jejuense]SNR15360.1 conserved protein of unknown function [Tenacibaculum jejuense]
MKKIICILIVIIGFSSYSQVKVGDNPNTIDINSLLELESPDKVFVLTRVSTLQMNRITPLEGALVYNTDEKCVHQYIGTSWESLCNAGGGARQLIFNPATNILTLSNGNSVDLSSLAEDNDSDPTNEIQDLQLNGNILTITNNSSATAIDLSVLSSSSDDQNIDNLTFNSTTNELTVGIENGNSVTVDLSSLVTNGSETKISVAGINTISGTGTTADPYIITATEVDGSVTNEVNTAFAVNAGNLEITDSNGTLSVPLTALGTDDQDIDVLTLNATTNVLTVGIENGADLTVDLSSLVADGSETSVQGAGINVVTGTGTTADPYIITATEVDGSVTNEVNTAFAVNAGNLEITDSNGTLSVPLTALGTDDQDIDVLTLNATTNVLTVGIENGADLTVDLSSLVADGSETSVQGAGINVVTGTGTTADPYIITATEVDGSVTNEVNTAFAVNAGNLEITDSNGTLSVPLTALGTDDQDIDVLTLNATTNVLTVGIENGADLTVDLSSLVADGSETSVQGAGINVVTGTGTTADPYIITATEVDGSVTNEVNTAFAVNAGNLEITDSNGTLSVPLTALGTDDQDIDVLTLNATTNVLTVGIENGADLTVDLSSLVADGSETSVQGAGINVVTGTGTTADPYIITATEVDGSVTNEVNTAFAVNAGNLEITDSNGTLSVPLTALGTDDQDIDVLTLNATTNVLTVGIENGADLTVDLSSLVADGSETSVQGAGINVVTGTGTTADPYIITATEVDGSVTNEVNTAFAVNAGNLEITDSNGTLSVPLTALGTDDQDIDVLTLNATTNVLTVGIENGADLTVDLSSLVADGSETSVQGAGINVVTGTGTTADPYIITATEVDGSVTNEVNTAFAVNAGNLEITDSNGTLSVPLTALGTDDQDIDVLTLNATTNVLTVGIENGADLTVDLSSLVADGSETSVQGAGINVVTGTGTTADPYIITATEVDGSVTNEVNTAFAVNAGNLEITDSNGTLSVPLTALGTDDQDIDVLTLNATTNVLTVGIENGADLTVDLSSLVADGSETRVQGAGINVVTGTGTTADPYIITATEVDGSVTNEVNTAFAVNAGNLEITDSNGTLSVPLTALGTDDQDIDVLTLNATTNVLTVGIENGADLTVDLSSLVADGSETSVQGAGINVVTGTGTTADPYIITATEVDGSVTNEVNTAFAVNAGNLEITDSNGTLSVPLTALGTDDQDIDVLTLNATTNVLTVGIENGADLTVDLSSLVADGSETSVQGAGINVVTGTGTTADPYIITATEVDGSVTNEVNTAFAVNAGNLEITDSNGTLSVPLTALGTDDQDIDVLTLNATTNVLTVGIENGADLTVDLSSLVADGSETSVQGAGINVVTGTGTTADPYIITATEVDGSVTNEVNTAFAVNAGNLEITDSNGTLSVPLTALGTDDQDIDVLTLNATTNVLTVGIENGADLTVDLSSLVADGSETSVQGAGINVVTGTGTTADPYIITATEVDGSVTNEVNTAFAVNAGNLEITDSNGTLSVPLTALGTDDQDIDVLTLNATTNVLTVGIENGADLTVDLSSLVADGSETSVQSGIKLKRRCTRRLGINVVTGTGTTADPYIITATEVDGSVTNEVNTAFAVNAGNLEITDSNGTLSVPLTALGTDDQDIDVLTLNATTNVLTVGIENGADLTVDLSSLVADGSETSVQGAGINVVTGTGTTADPYIITATEVDGSVTNEVNTAFAVNAGNLEITDSNGTLSVPLTALGTDDQDIDVLTLNATTNVLTVGIENGADLTVDLSSLVADGSETSVQGAGINVVTGTGTTADPYIITATEVDGSVTNEVNTAFAVNAGNLEITDSNGTLSVPLTALGTDDQDIDVLTLNATTNVLTVGIENGADLTVDLSSLVADGSETSVQGAGINVVTGTGTTADPYIITATEVDGSVTNEVNTAFAVNAGNLEITDSNGTLSVPLTALGTDDQDIDVLTLNATTNVLTVGIENGADLTVDLSSLVADGSETSVQGAGINVVTGTGTTADPYIITATEVDGSVTNEVNTAFAVNAGNLEITDSNGTLSVPLTALGTDDQDIDVLTLNATTNVLTVGIENGADLTVDLSSLVADGSETSVQGAGINVVTGTGTTADPYIITATEVDGSVTNEVNTAFAVNAGNLEITDSNGTLSVPLTALGTDDQDIDVLTLNATTNVLTVGIENGADLTVDLSSLVADGSETSVQGAGINVVTGTGTTADPYIITATEVDGSVTNEVNTAFAVNAGNLEITDSNGTLSVPLTALGTDDQDIDVLTLNATTNVLTVGIENGADLTVDLSSLVADGSETSVQGAGINVVTGTGTTADPYIITATEVDGSVTNEVNTAFAVNAGNLEITDSNGTLSVPLTALGTDDQDIDVLTLNATTNVLTVGIENGADLTVDLSSLVADGSETSVQGAGINVVTGTGTTADPYIITATEVDGSVTNEVNTAFAVNAGNLQITDSNGTLSVPLTALGTDDQTVDQFTFNTTNNQLSISLEDDGAAPLIVDLSSLVSNVTTVAQAGSLSGRTIATHSSNGTNTNIQETVTTLTQNDTPSSSDPSATGEITYTDESGTTSTAQVVSADANNNLQVGTDGGAYLSGSTIRAMGKVNGTTGNLLRSQGVTSVTRNGVGNYTVTIPDRGNADYVVQLTVFSVGNLQVTGQVIAQTSNSFTVQLYGSNVYLYRLDRNWYFSVQDF